MRTSATACPPEKERGLPVRQEYILEYSSMPVDDDAMYGLFKQEQRPTAIVAGDDILAVSLERVIFSMGLRIPEDVSIASFIDSLISRLTLPQLTSENINSLQLGIEAASQIINHSENPALLSTKISVPHRIVERGSCSPLLIKGKIEKKNRRPRFSAGRRFLWCVYMEIAAPEEDCFYLFLSPGGGI